MAHISKFQSTIKRVASPTKIFAALQGSNEFKGYVEAQAAAQIFEKGAANDDNVTLLCSSELEPNKVIAAIASVVDNTGERDFSGRKFLSLIKGAVRPTTATATIEGDESE